MNVCLECSAIWHTFWKRKSPGDRGGLHITNLLKRGSHEKKRISV